jgi:predicted RNA-binding Zn-ribbon protein involved in translation (DUF1610 family)
MRIRSYLTRRWVKSVWFHRACGDVRNRVAVRHQERRTLRRVAVWRSGSLRLDELASVSHPCPNCGKPMETVALFIVSGRGAITYRCPKCGIGLDKELPAALTEPALGSPFPRRRRAGGRSCRCRCLGRGACGYRATRWPRVRSWGDPAAYLARGRGRDRR